MCKKLQSAGMIYHMAHAMAGGLLRSYVRLSSRHFCNYVTKEEFAELHHKFDASKTDYDELHRKFDATKTDYDSFKARVTADVIIWGTPLIHIVAGDLVNFLTGNVGKRAESLNLEHNKKNEPFLYPGIEEAAARCNIKFHDFRRACDRSRVDRNRIAHAHDLDELALKIGHVRELFDKYPFLKQREADQFMLVSNFELIRKVIEDLFGNGLTSTSFA